MKISKGKGGWRIELPMDSWYGTRGRQSLYRRIDLQFPLNWDIEVFEPDAAGQATPLSSEEIAQALREPIDAEPLRKLAEGRRSAAIVIDDLSRPTPAFAVLPTILEDLEAGGIGPDKTRIVISLGTHRPLTKAELRRKLGRDVVDEIEVINHNCFSRRVTRFDHPDGSVIGINRAVGEAELKIAVSGIIPHGGAGFGGGAKAILPGVADYQTIQHNHTLAWEPAGTQYPERITSACIRRGMEQAVGAVGLDFSVNLVFSPYKEVLGVFAGHFIRAHRAGCAFARPRFLTRTPAEPLDLVIANGYPMDTDFGQSHRGSWPEKHGQASVLMGGARDGWAYHGDNGKSWRVYRKMKREQQSMEGYRFKGAQKDAGEGTSYYYSPRMTPERFYEHESDRVFCNQWEDVVQRLERQGGVATVGVFPYASVQLPEE